MYIHASLLRGSGPFLYLGDWKAEKKTSQTSLQLMFPMRTWTWEVDVLAQEVGRAMRWGPLPLDPAAAGTSKGKRSCVFFSSIPACGPLSMEQGRPPAVWWRCSRTFLEVPLEPTPPTLPMTLYTLDSFSVKISWWSFCFPNWTLTVTAYKYLSWQSCSRYKRKV